MRAARILRVLMISVRYYCLALLDLGSRQIAGSWRESGAWRASVLCWLLCLLLVDIVFCCCALLPAASHFLLGHHTCCLLDIKFTSYVLIL